MCRKLQNTCSTVELIKILRSDKSFLVDLKPYFFDSSSTEPCEQNAQNKKKYQNSMQGQIDVKGIPETHGRLRGFCSKITQADNLAII
jgi:hypothetical protein